MLMCQPPGGDFYQHMNEAPAHRTELTAGEENRLRFSAWRPVRRQFLRGQADAPDDVGVRVRKCFQIDVLV